MSVGKVPGISRFSGRLPRWVALVLIVAIAFDVLGFYRDQRALRPTIASTPISLRHSRAIIAFNVRNIPSAHLFGASPESDNEHAAESRIPLVLTGTFALPDPRRGFAIIGESADKARLFAVGANLPNGARLDQVLPDRVVLALNGEEQVLLLPRLRGGAVPEIAVEQSTVAEVAAADAGQGDAVATDPREFSQARHWFSGFAAQPIAQDDGIQGYVLHPNMRYKREYGVTDGDVVTSINGVALADMDTAATELQKFSGQVVSMTVVHDGVPQDMELQVN